MSKKKITIAALLVTGLLFSLGNVANVFAIPSPCIKIDTDGNGSEDGSICDIGLSAISPYDGETGVSTSATLSFTTADPSVTASTGNLYIVNDTTPGTTTIPCASLTHVGDTFSIGMSLSANQNYHIEMQSTCTTNSSILISSGDSTTWNFSTASIPSLTSSSPVNGSSNVCYTRGLTLNFDQNVYGDLNSAGGVFKLTCGGVQVFSEICDSATFGGDGTATLTKSIAYPQNKPCVIDIDNKCIHNSTNTYWAGDSISFTTNSTTCPGGVCTFPPIFNPLDDAVNVPLDADLVADFMDQILYIHDYYDTVRNSTVEIRRSADNSLYASYDIYTSPEVSGVYTKTLTIDPVSNFPPSTAFYVNMTEVLTEGCPLYDILDTVTWNFTTSGSAPVTLINKLPRNNRVNVNIDTYLELEYDNPLFRGSGSIRVYQTAGDVLIDTIPAASARVYGIGTNTVRIFPVNSLVYKTDYYIVMDQGFLNGGSPASPAKEIKKMEWFWRTKRSNEEPFWRNWTDDRP